MFARIAVAVPLGIAVAAGLLFVMQLMVATGRPAITAAPQFKVTDFVRVEREEIVQAKERKPEKTAGTGIGTGATAPAGLPDPCSRKAARGICARRV